MSPPPTVLPAPSRLSLWRAIVIAETPKLAHELHATGITVVAMRSPSCPPALWREPVSADLVLVESRQTGLLQHLKQPHPPIVLVGASSEEAMLGYEIGAIGFLLQPLAFDPVARLLERLGPKRAPASAPARRLVLRDGSRTLLLRPESIDWIEATGNYVRIHAEGSHRLVRSTLAGVERHLDPDAFVRIHRGAIVAIDRIAMLEPAGRDLRAVLRDGRRLPTSRTYRSRLEAALGLADNRG